jgi:hypothetical protein
LKAGETESAFKNKSATYRNNTRPKPRPKREQQEGEVNREQLVETLLLLKPFVGKETITDTNYFVFHKNHVIACDDNIVVMAPTNLNLSCAVRPNLLDTLQSCKDKFVKITYHGDHVKVLMDSSGESTIEAEGHYQFTLARKHLQEALNGSDNIMYVGEGAIMFEKSNYQHAIPTCTNGKQELGYLVKH